MKVIDLLNKIAKGEEVPKIIKYDTIYYYFRNYDYKEYEILEDYIDEQSSFIEKIDFYKLNDEIEIIEEEKDIEEIDICTGGIMGFDGVENITGALKDKINELVREINKLKNK